MTLGRIRLLGLLASLIVAALLLIVGQDMVRNPIFDLWQRMAPRDLSKTDVRVVWIDEESLQARGSWPWSRLHLRSLVQNMTDAGAEIIGFDMIFAEPDVTDPKNFSEIYKDFGLPPAAAAQIAGLRSMDSEFAETMRNSFVVLGRAGLDREAPDVAVKLESSGELAGPLGSHVRHWPAALINIPEIDQAAVGHGLINGDPDFDGVVRRVPLVGNVLKTDMIGMALEMARLSKGGLPLRPELEDGKLRSIQLGSVTIPAQNDGSMRLRFGRLPPEANISALDVLEGKLKPGALSGKIVLVGLQGEGTADVVVTPLSATAYGTEVQANALDSILKGETLVRPRWAWIAEGLLTVLLVWIAVRILPKLSMTGSAGLQVAALVATFTGSFAAFALADLLLDPVSPILVAAAASLVMLILLFAQARLQRELLAVALQEERVVAARSQGELSAARDIQLGMLPRREALSSLDPTIEVDAFVEPARSIGGDFYDAVRVDDERVCFLVGDVTGKGVPAALFMALSKALTKSVLLRDGRDLAAAVSRLNEEIARDNSEDMFVTMLFGLFNTHTGELALCNAGHENPWIVRADGSIEALNPEGGPPLSVAPGFPYDAETVNLWPGDMVVIVSDGITEAQSPSGAFFGQERLREVLRNWGPDEGVETAGAALLREVRAFEDGEDATDDLTVLAFRYRPI